MSERIREVEIMKLRCKKLENEIINLKKKLKKSKEEAQKELLEELSNSHIMIIGNAKIIPLGIIKDKLKLLDK